MGFRCEFSYSNYEGYTCLITSAEIEEPENGIGSFSSFIGDHNPKKTNADVRTLRFTTNFVTVIPRSISDVFPNLSRLSFKNCCLKSISREDLKGLHHLEELQVEGTLLQTLPDDLFTNTPKLRTILFDFNKIKSMSSKLFQPIINNRFRMISFCGNVKIDACYSPLFDASLADFLKIIDSKCSKPTPVKPPASLDFSSSRLGNFEKLFIFEKLSDFVVVHNKGMGIHVHKCVLAAQCEGFAEMFEKNPNATTMEIEGLSRWTVESFLRFLYTGKLENFEGFSLELFALASKLKASEIKEPVKKVIISQLNPSNAFQTFSLAHTLQSNSLKQAAFKVIQKMFPGKELPEKLIDDLPKVKELILKKKHLDSALNNL